MSFEKWSRLSAEEQERGCQGLIPGEDWPLFKAIEGEFIARYGKQSAVGGVFCGFASGVGPLNAITVSIKRGAGRANLPKRFMGFPVLRAYGNAAKPGAPTNVSP